MAFYGNSFTFNDIPCDDFDLMLYAVDQAEPGAGTFASIPEIQEEERPTRWRPFFFGTKYTKKLEFELVFGVNQTRLDQHQYLDRYELDAVASWLTGHNEYKRLAIVQEDMSDIHYRCFISNLEVIEYGLIPWALKATVICDSPYAYLPPKTFVYQVNGEKTVSLLNESSYNGYYYPIVEFNKAEGSSLSIRNQTDDGRIFHIEKIPSGVHTVIADCDLEIIDCDTGENLYDGFNFNFLRLKRGHNTLTITGNGTVKIRCEFPVNAGG